MNGYGIALIAALCVLTTASIYACCVLSSENSERMEIPSNHQFGAVVSDKLMPNAWHE